MNAKIHASGHLSFDAREMAASLRPLMNKGLRTRVGPVRVTFRDGNIQVSGEWFGVELPAAGNWPGTVELWPRVFLELFKKLPAEGSSSLRLSNGSISLGGLSTRVKKIILEPNGSESRDASPVLSTEHVGGKVSVSRKDFEKACALFRKHCKPSPAARATFHFDGEHLDIDVAGIGHALPAEGVWTGIVETSAQFMVGIAKVPPNGDPIEVRVEGDRLHIGSCSITCVRRLK
jgi:hypothetical protein